MSGLDHRLEPEVEVRRFEVINGAMGRRRWTADDRARILDDVAPNFYPAVSSFWRLDLPCRACGAAGADAEPFMLRSV